MFFNNNVSEFARKTQIPQTTLNNIVANKLNSPSAENLEKILVAMPDINSEWLLTGNGEMLKKQEQNATIVETSDNEAAILLYNVSASAGYGSFDEMISNEKLVGNFAIPGFTNIDWMIYVAGSSMYPKYSGGDIIGCRILHESRFIQWGKVYVVATREQGILVKRLKQSENVDCIKAVSDNENYDAFDIPKDEILGIALVVGVVRLE